MDPSADIATELNHAAALEDDASFVIEVVSGADRGSTFRIDRATEMATLLGQSPACMIRLRDPSVSRRHLAFEPAGVRLRVRDLGSSNGTFVSGVRVVEALIDGGEEVRVGATTLRVTRAQSPDAPAPSATSFGALLAASRAVRRIFPLLERLAASNVPVLVEGETGTGKEVLARSLHERGPRAKGPFVVFDCSAVAANVIESELFGHERGAFTGAVNARKGLFEQASGGTIFLDELGELPLDLQGRLLRAIERSEIRRVGGNEWITVDVRVIAATRRDIDAYVESGRFRDDLFHRLAVGRVELPPLRKRREDVPLLAAFFAREVDADATIPPHMLEDWRDRPWPGNVRELRNAVLRHLALGELDDASELEDDDASTLASGSESPSDAIEAVLRLRLPFPKARARVMRAFEERYLEEMLQISGGNIPRAAQAAGVAVRYFQILRARNKKAR